MSKTLRGGSIMIAFLLGCIFMRAITTSPRGCEPIQVNRAGEPAIIINYKKNDKSLLSRLCDQYGSDKGSIKKDGHPYPWIAHSYADFYSRLFEQSRNKIQRVFECGVGTNKPDAASSMGVNGIPGASLRVWRDYFPHAQIYGADIDREILFNEERIKTYYMDQTNAASIRQFWNQVSVADFDFMLDDGLHTFDAGITLFENSISRLAENGVYIIEDIEIKDLPKYKQYFADKKYQVEYVSLLRPGLCLDNNSLVVIRKTPSA